MSEARERIKDYCDRQNVINPESGIRIPYELVDALLAENEALREIVMDLPEWNGKSLDYYLSPSRKGSK